MHGSFYPMSGLPLQQNSERYMDQSLAYKGTATGFGEAVTDRTRIDAGEDVLSVLYQKSSSGLTPSELLKLD
jgi:hypothetical protein